MAKKKKKSQAGGLAGKPAFSEPRVQVFSKFAGCNFQLAERDFDDVFAEDQEPQSDLMPMYMAIQNNADAVPMGGIETRPNIVKLFDAPLDIDGKPKAMTGVAALIGDRLFVACDDMTIHHGVMADGALAEFENELTVEDLNDTYGAMIGHAYSGVVE